MDRPLPRDPNGYLDLDGVADDEVELDLAAIAPVPPLSDEVWGAIVSAAPHVDVDAAGIDVDTLARATLPPENEPTDVGIDGGPETTYAHDADHTMGAPEPPWPEGSDPGVGDEDVDGSAGDVSPPDLT